jgi:hypothetical protein
MVSLHHARPTVGRSAAIRAREARSPSECEAASRGLRTKRDTGESCLESYSRVDRCSVFVALVGELRAGNWIEPADFPAIGKEEESGDSA